MIRHRIRAAAVLITLLTALSLGAASLAKGVFLNTSDVKWMTAKPPLPPTVKVAVLAGDPSKAGEYTIRLMAPAGTKLPPHWHGETENVTVISGTAGIGLGSKWNQSKLVMIGPGGFFSIPAKTAHFFWAKTDTVVQVNAIGPRTMVMLK